MTRAIPICLAAALMIAWAGGARAQRGSNRGARPAPLEPCDIEHDRGRLAEARQCYRELLSAGDPQARAEAHWMLGDLKAANQGFREAVRLDPENPDLRVRWGHLYVDSHQDAEAAALFEEALEIDGEHVPARLGMARVLSTRFDGKAIEAVRATLEERPRQVEGHLLLARMALEEGDREQARESLEAALRESLDLEVAPLESYALLASLEMLEGHPESEWVRKTLEYNPRYGEVYAEQAHFYVINRRYREATERLRRALDVNPRLWRAHAELGVNLLREGRDAEARRHLETAYEGDPYSAKTVNTLRLLDMQDSRFETFSSAAPAVGAVPRAIVRLDTDEAELLRPYVLDLVERAIEEFSRKYEFELDRPVRVDLYPNHEDFAVRTMGMPGVGLLGVTFGDVVAMDSPSGRAPGDFHWGTTLWHEMAHVFTLQATANLVPRWYSEGISMYEEWMADPRWGEPVTPDFIQAVRKGDLLPVAELDRGFIRPRYPEQIAVSYMQAGYACRYIAETWGEGKLVELLQGFAAGTGTAANIQEVLAIAPEQFDEGLDTYIRDDLGPAVDGTRSWRRSLESALEAARDKEWDAVFEPAEAARRAYPQHVGVGCAYSLLAMAHEGSGDRAAAIAELQEYERRGGRQPETLSKLAGWLEEAGRGAEAAYTYDGLLYVWPQEERTHARLGELHLAAGRTDLAVREFEAALALDPLDRAEAEYSLARAYVKIGDLAKARLHVLQALESAPTYRPALQLLMRVKK